MIDGLDNRIDINYDAPGTYSGDTCVGNWPEKCLRTANNLVSSHTEGFASPSNPLSVERTYKYHYANARVNVTGHGWLGFEHRTIDYTSGAGDDATTTIDYEPPTRFDVSGQAVQNPINPPYVYPFAGLPQTVTVDVRTASGPGSIKPPLQSGYFDRRSQTINNWKVQISSFNHPFPVVQTRTRSTYERQVSGGGSINPTRPAFADNGALVTQCLDSFSVDDYGNMSQSAWQCQGQESFLEESDTVSTFTPDPLTWIISNPNDVRIFSTHVDGTDVTTVRESRLTYDGQGLLHTVTRAPNGTSDQQTTTTYDRDDFGNVHQITETAPGETARVTTISYDGDNIFPATTTNAEGQPTQTQFDPKWGEPLTVVDPNGIAVQMSYDDFGRIGQTTGPTGTSITTYSFIQNPNAITAVGGISPRIDVKVERQGTAGTPDGSSRVELDNYGRIVRTHTDGFAGADVIEEQAYDAAGRSLGRTLPHTASTTPVPFDKYSYDALRRFARVDHSDGSYSEIQHATSASIDPGRSQWTRGMTCDFGTLLFCAVNYTLTIDEVGHQNATVSDFVGRPLRSFDGNNVDSGAQFSRYVYGTFNTLVQTHDNRDLVTSFTYDDFGRQTSQADADVGARTYTYNGFDELRTSNDPKHQLRTYHHDSLGRLTSVVDPAGTTQWVYDQGVNALGRLSASISPATAENPAGQIIQYAYEPPTSALNRGLLAAAVYTIDNATDYAVTFDYDDLGRTDRIHYPIVDGGRAVVTKNLFDSSGVLDGVDEVGSGMPQPVWRMNDAFQGHLVQHETFGNGATTAYAYDASRYFLDSIQTKLSNNTIQSLSYTHYSNGQIHQLTGKQANPLEYVYDNLNRLSQINTVSNNNPTSETYGYDDIGNLVNRAGTTTSYVNGAPHLVDQVGGNSYLYDQNGNVSFRGGPDVPGNGQVLFYTPFDLPKTIATSTSDTTQRTTQFDYSADQERLVRRDVDSSTLHFVTDLYQRKLDSSGNTLEERFRLYAGGRQLGEIVRKDGAEETLYFHTDHLGSTDTISDSSGGVTGQSFDAFGKPDSPQDLTRVGFTGQDQDVDLGFTDMKGRIYDPLAGRFTSQDPVMQAPFWSQGLNRYSYVFNDPINNTDPSGFSVSTWVDIGSVPFTGGVVGLLAYEAGWFDGAATASDVASSGGSAAAAAGGGAASALGVAGGIAGVAANVAEPFLNGGLAGQAHAGRSFSVTPTATARSANVGSGSAQAKGQNHGSVHELAKPPAPKPASNSEWGPTPDLSNTSGPYEAPSVPNKVLSNKEFKIEDTSETWKRLFEAATIFVPGPGEAEAGGVVVAEAAPKFVNPKFAAQLEQQLARDGAKSIFKSLRSLEGRLAEHEAKLPSLPYKSSVEREIRAFKDQIETLRQFIGHSGLKP